MAQEVVKGSGGGAQARPQEAWCQVDCDRGAKEMSCESILLKEAIETIYRMLAGERDSFDYKLCLSHLENIIGGKFSSSNIVDMKKGKRWLHPGSSENWTIEEWDGWNKS